MSRFSMSNGTKATAVTAIGLLSLAGVIFLAYVGKVDPAIVAAQLLGNLGLAMGFLTGASAPDGPAMVQGYDPSIVRKYLSDEPAPSASADAPARKSTTIDDPAPITPAHHPV